MKLVIATVGNGTPDIIMFIPMAITNRVAKFKVGLKIQLRISIKMFMVCVPNKVRSLYTYGHGLQALY